MVVELEFLLGGEVPADSEVRRVLDQSLLVRHVQRVVDQPARCQRHEGVPAEETRADRRPLRFAGRVVQVHLVDRAELGAVPVECLAADQTAGIDIGLHGSSYLPELPCAPYETVHFPPRPLEGCRAVALVGWSAIDDPVRESPPSPGPEAPKEQLLPGISQAPVPRGRDHSGKQGGPRSSAVPEPLLTDGENRALRTFR
ncbi:hypothetical protein GCM10010361_74280 [Streptomyces olivaceiscleroticus]|uniref:Uncharacterized protein n=1 Tax=Streptomyces olivaceiscleroticus TaxID=68245 RepID=A0ABP3LCD5_9ACTN